MNLLAVTMVIILRQVETDSIKVCNGRMAEVSSRTGIFRQETSDCVESRSMTSVDKHEGAGGGAGDGEVTSGPTIMENNAARALFSNIHNVGLWCVRKR